MRQTRPPLPSAADLPLEPMPIEQIDAQFKGRWVLVRVTAVNEFHTTVEGQVVAYGARKRIFKALYKIAAERPDPDTHHLFKAGVLVRPGTEAMRRLLDPSARSGESGASG